jgi:3-dehydroquinate synthase
MNQTVSINLAKNSYDIFIQDSFDFSKIAYLLENKKIAIITNETVAPLYLQELKSCIAQQSDSEIFHLVLADGEPYKNFEHWQKIIDFLAMNGFNRSDLLISLGGGVICDMTGFAAASWMRGIDFIQVPTTLLAQIDASVGGKTGINHKYGKNLIGAFHQPQAVIINTESLKTLNNREFAAGIGEAVKYGYINQPDFIHWLMDNAEGINNHDADTLSQMISKCCQFKANIVEQDEKETGVRALLNLGHTFAHAIETLTAYKQYLHGEAVAIGMVMAAELSNLLLKPSCDIKQSVIDVLTKLNVQPFLKQPLDPHELVKLMRMDKKSINKKNRFILMDDFGSSIIKSDIDEWLIVEAMIHCMKDAED